VSSLAHLHHSSPLDTVSAALQSLPNHVVFNAQLPLFASNNSLRRLVCVAIDRAIREIIAPVVERSVTIAGISTRELTMKDFAMEGDESKMGTAAHLMVQNLAGSLALVTCKEPLRLSMVTHIRNLLLQNGFTEENIPEQAILVLAGENLDLACSVVEKVAMEKAVLEVDDGLSPAYLSRRGHREVSKVSEFDLISGPELTRFTNLSQRSREAFWDTAAMAASHYSGMLPDPLRLKLGGLSERQLLVYEEFARLRVLPPALPTSVDGRNGLVYSEPSPAVAAAPTPVLAEPVLLTAPQVMEKFAVSSHRELARSCRTHSDSLILLHRLSWASSKRLSPTKPLQHSLVFLKNRKFDVSFNKFLSSPLPPPHEMRLSSDVRKRSCNSCTAVRALSGVTLTSSSSIDFVRSRPRSRRRSRHGSFTQRTNANLTSPSPSRSFKQGSFKSPNSTFSSPSSSFESSARPFSTSPPNSSLPASPKFLQSLRKSNSPTSLTLSRRLLVRTRPLMRKESFSSLFRTRKLIRLSSIVRWNSFNNSKLARLSKLDPFRSPKLLSTSQQFVSSSPSVSPNGFAFTNNRTTSKSRSSISSFSYKSKVSSMEKRSPRSSSESVPRSASIVTSNTRLLEEPLLLESSNLSTLSPNLSLS